MLKIVEFIKANKDWKEQLTNPPYSLKIKEENGLVLFNYNQLESDPSLPITREARGLVLEEGTWSVVRCGFFRFFNIGEPYCDTIDWESSTSSIKHDGTLIFIYYYNGWRVGTRSSFDAENAEMANIKYRNFRALFDAVAAQYKFDLNTLEKGYTYCLELCSRDNRVVVDYETPCLYHILTRNNSTLEEVDMNIDLPKPAQYILENEQDYRDLVNSFDENTEGIVIKDKDNHRVKLKTLKYFELHRMICNHAISIEAIVEMIRTGEDKEFLSYFKEYTEQFDIIRKRWNDIQDTINSVQDRVNNWKRDNPDATRKDFSKFVQLNARTPVLWFKAYDNKAKEWFDSLPVAKICNIFKIKEI